MMRVRRSSAANLACLSFELASLHSSLHCEMCDVLGGLGSALGAEIESGRLKAGIDVFPQEPFGRAEPLRKMKGVILSRHRTGGMKSAFLNIGKLVVADTELLLRGFPPQNCKRAERETVAKMRSRPLAKVMM